MSGTPVEAVGATAAAITAFQVVRQLFDAWNAGEAEGVSRATWELALVQSVALGVLSAANGYLAAVFVNLFVGLCTVAILLLLSKHHGVVRFWVFLVMVALVTCVLLALRGAVLVGTVGAVASALVWVPQAMHSFHTRSDVGLSWPFVAAGLASSVLWAVYALLLGEWRLLVAPIVAILSMLVTASRSMLTQAQAD